MSHPTTGTKVEQTASAPKLAARERRARRAGWIGGGLPEAASGPDSLSYLHPAMKEQMSPSSPWRGRARGSILLRAATGQQVNGLIPSDPVPAHAVPWPRELGGPYSAGECSTGWRVAAGG